MSAPPCLTPFRVVRCTDPARGNGFKAVWVHVNLRNPGNDALAWRPSKEAVRQSMANLYADVIELRGGE